MIRKPVGITAPYRRDDDDDIQDYKKPWVGLNDEEMLSIEETTTCTKDESWLRNVTRAIEAKLKEKNT